MSVELKIQLEIPELQKLYSFWNLLRKMHSMLIFLCQVNIKFPTIKEFEKAYVNDFRSGLRNKSN